MKGYAMLKIGEAGWITKDSPQCGPLDALVRPLVVAPCTSDIHTVWEGAVGERHDMILGHECVGQVVEAGTLVRDFKPGDRVIVPAITPRLEQSRGAGRILDALGGNARRMEIFQHQGWSLCGAFPRERCGREPCPAA